MPYPLKQLGLLMVLVFLLQSVVAAVELGAQAANTDDPHHALGGISQTIDDHSHSTADDPTSDDACDHCCHCHGHCSHLTLVVHLEPYLDTDAAFVGSWRLPGALRQSPSSIDRPPIA